MCKILDNYLSVGHDKYSNLIRELSTCHALSLNSYEDLYSDECHTLK